MKSWQSRWFNLFATSPRREKIHHHSRQPSKEILASKGPDGDRICRELQCRSACFETISFIFKSLTVHKVIIMNSISSSSSYARICYCLIPTIRFQQWSSTVAGCVGHTTQATRPSASNARWNTGPLIQQILLRYQSSPTSPPFPTAPSTRWPAGVQPRLPRACVLCAHCQVLAWGYSTGCGWAHWAAPGGYIQPLPRLWLPQHSCPGWSYPALSLPRVVVLDPPEAVLASSLPPWAVLSGPPETVIVSAMPSQVVVSGPPKNAVGSAQPPQHRVQGPSEVALVRSNTTVVLVPQKCKGSPSSDSSLLGLSQKRRQYIPQEPQQA